ncbi:hypothetical protein [Bradyrhizobium sp. SZCCHNR1070]|uniref:hypothetical protein n=1 Tax=Bradyrhizobium sp. SZCCHNR1070 TaxID=3057361 RepID=UPI0029163C46|nr:hypothetical protein [Bradyrhizobium sp. SZCCHNR1070]
MALVDRRLVGLRYDLQGRLVKHRSVIIVLPLIVALILSYLLTPVIQRWMGDYFNPERFTALRGLLATLGGALVGATAIGFSVVMIAVQLNFARMPHGLFRRLSSDAKLLGAFAGTFFLAIGVSALSIVPDAGWAAMALIGTVWGTVLILILFLYGYRRALYLINPLVQLRLLIEEAQQDLRRWARRAERLAVPLLQNSLNEKGEVGDVKYDRPRLAFLRANPQWTVTARRAVGHCVSFARRYAEQDDFAVSGRALEAVIVINASYVHEKGRTFFQSNPIVDVPEASDVLINDTLEHLRRLVRASIGRADEEATRQVLTTIAALVRVYLTIEYANPGLETKEHAQLAAGYLVAAVEGVLPRDMPDLAMEGIRLVGTSAREILVSGHPNEIATLVEKIATFAVAGVFKPDYRVLTLVGMEQMARLTLDLLRTRTVPIEFAADNIRSSVELVVGMFLETPDTPLASNHSSYLAPYYSLTKTKTLSDDLTELCNALIAADTKDENARAVLRNCSKWSEELYRTQKKLLLLSIEKKSHFTFDVLHWIQHVTKLLVAISHAAAADNYTREKLEENAINLISVIFGIPEDEESIRFVESFSMPALIFEMALDAISFESRLVVDRARDLLIQWAFKAGRYNTGWGTLGRSMAALVALAVLKEEFDIAAWLKAEIPKRLKRVALEQEVLDRAARDLRRKAVSIRGREFEPDPINHVISQLEATKVRQLLMEVADILSPSTAAEDVSSDYF